MRQKYPTIQGVSLGADKPLGTVRSNVEWLFARRCARARYSSSTSPVKVAKNEDGELQPYFRLQVRQALSNLRIALLAAGAGPGDIAKLTVLVVDHDEERLRVFGSELDLALDGRPKPTCTLIPVPRLALDGMLFEVEAVAVLPA